MKNEFVKLAEAYLEDLDGLLKEAADEGFFGLDYDDEKLAAFKSLVLTLDDEEMAELDKTAYAMLDGMEKLAQWGAIMGLIGKGVGALGRGAAAVGGRMAGYGGKLVARAGEPTKQFTQFLTARGRSPEFIASRWKEFQQAGGPMQFLRQRAVQRAGRQQFERAVFEMPAAAPAAAGELSLLPAAAGGRARGAGRIAVPEAPAAAPAAAAPAAAGAVTGKKVRWWDPVVSGAKWGLGFAALQRLLGGQEAPEVRYLGQ